MLLNWGSKLLWSNWSCGYTRLGSVNDTKSFRAEFRFLMNIGFSWNLLVDIGLGGNLNMLVWNNLGSSTGCSSKAN